MVCILASEEVRHEDLVIATVGEDVGALGKCVSDLFGFDWEVRCGGERKDAYLKGLGSSAEDVAYEEDCGRGGWGAGLVCKSDLS